MKKLEPIFDLIGEILALVLVALHILALANANWHFLDNIPVVMNILNIALTYGTLLLMAVVGLEAISKRNIVLRIIFYACLAIIVMFLFFPETYSNFIGLITH